jgi:DNA-binding Xre family transcriptional regulator
MDRHAERTGHRLTYKELASLAGVAQATVESLASREEYNPTLKTLGRLCAALQCTPAELLVLASEGKRANGGTTGDD